MTPNTRILMKISTEDYLYTFSKFSPPWSKVRVLVIYSHVVKCRSRCEPEQF